MKKKKTMWDLFKARFRPLFCKHRLIIVNLQTLSQDDYQECEDTKLMCTKCNLLF